MCKRDAAEDHLHQLGLLIAVGCSHAQCPAKTTGKLNKTLLEKPIDEGGAERCDGVRRQTQRTAADELSTKQETRNSCTRSQNNQVTVCDAYTYVKQDEVTIRRTEAVRRLATGSNTRTTQTTVEVKSRKI